MTGRERQRLRTQAANYGWVAVMFLLAGVIAIQLTKPKPFDPLVLPRQSVLSTVKGYEGPAVYLGDLLKVRATKCINGGTAVKIAGQTYWQALQPPGASVTGGGGARERPPGCATVTYLNPLPAEVVRLTERYFADGRSFATWQLIGIEKPEGANTVERTWTTGPFRVYPAEPK